MSGYKVELLNINKSFGGIKALNNVSLKARSGEIHAIVGENGAGKSTLMKILAGSYRMDSGEIRIDQQKQKFNKPWESKKAGIGIIYQEFALIPDLSVAENIFIHYLNQKKTLIPWSQINREAYELIKKIGFAIPTSKKIHELSTAQQQIVEIAKAMSEDTEILILDEPTAVLAPRETQKLFEILTHLKNQGVAILYISHRLEEIFQIADMVTILKDGMVTKTGQTKDLSQDDVITSMIGRKLNTLFPERKASKLDKVLEVKNISSGELVREVSFELKAGEVLGIAGLVGSGRTETLRAIFSADKRDLGDVLINHKNLKGKSPREAVRAGIGFVPEDRKTQGVLLDQSVRHNMTLTDLKSVSGMGGIIRDRHEKKAVSDLIELLGVKAESSESKAYTLSGGNQQKLVLAKWLFKTCKVVLLDEPTRGIDVGAKAEIYQLINDLAEKGIGVVLVSSEMIELIGMCDRILVMHEGRINGELQRSEFSEEAIMRLSIAKSHTYESS